MVTTSRIIPLGREDMWDWSKGSPAYFPFLSRLVMALHTLPRTRKFRRKGGRLNPAPACSADRLPCLKFGLDAFGHDEKAHRTASLQDKAMEPSVNPAGIVDPEA